MKNIAMYLRNAIPAAVYEQLKRNDTPILTLLAVTSEKMKKQRF